MHDLVESHQALAAIREVPSRLVTQNVAAALTGLTRRQIAGLMDAGHIASVQVGQRRMVLRWSLEALFRDGFDAA